MSNAKVVELDHLVNIASKLRGEGKKIVLCHGVFDLLHIGHIRHFSAARAFGDVLMVTVTPDQYVNKGPWRPAFGSELRAEAVASLDAVDHVAINTKPTATEVILILKPAVYAKDIEYKFKQDKRFEQEAEAASEVGAEVRFTTETSSSSSNLINRQVYREEVVGYLERFNRRYRAEDVHNWLNNIGKLKVLVVGETIIDQYCAGKHMGKTRRESIVEFMVEKVQRFIGGCGIIANHLAQFAGQVDILTLLGERDSQEEFVRGQLDPAISAHLFTKKDSPTPVKTRYIEEAVGHRNLFKVTEMNDRRIDKETSDNIVKTLHEILPRYDLVTVADFGHGMIDDHIVAELTASAPYLAVSTQINAENKGYNTIGKYPKVDYGCINEDELRLMTRDKYGERCELVSRLVADIPVDKLAVTMGYQGCMTYSEQDGIREAPALALDAIDAMGAGDAFFAVTSPLARLDVPMEVIGFVGNAVGAIYIKVLGNLRPVGKDELLQYARSLMR